MNGIVWVLGGANTERGDVLAKGCTRSEPAEITEATLLCSNRSHPALQQRTTILKEHNVYVLRTDWTKTKIAQVQEPMENFEQGPPLEAPSLS